jgi:tetratricopeptide (TPR) repeat protein
VSTDEVAESVAVPPAEEVAPVPTTVVVEIEGPPVAGEPVTAEESLPAEALPAEPSVAAVSPTPVVEESAPVPAQTGADEQPPLAVRESEQASLALAIERYKQQLQQNPKDEETRLALARAYTAQEYIELALAQYKMLERAKLAILSEAIADMESIVASRPDNLSAHELLADLYARSGQLQKALDRYRWLLGQFELKTA